ncbi:cytochrome P450 [Kitasatospora sp. NPDC058965]|uniref:cytochrome P450 n=1 Tax=Kitasatospora sp. NPDC058965 TaxID=3346682 RepID=UPI00368B7A09
MSFRPDEVDPANPYPLYRWYREHDPVHRAEDGSWYLFGHQAVARVLSGRADYRRGPHPVPVPPDCPHLARTVARWTVSLAPPEHTRVRALVARSLAPRTVQLLRPRIRRLAEELAEALAAELAERGEADFVGAFAAPLPVLVISELLGVPRTDRAWFRARAVELRQATGARPAVDATAGGYRRAERAAVELDGYVRAELRSGACRERGDLLGAMLRHAGELPEDTVVATCLHLLTAGHGTTTGLLANGLLALLEHPKELALLRSRPQLAGPAVAELLRYDPPVQLITRYAGRADRIEGREVAEGSAVTLVLGSANRDPARFRDPDRLDLLRDSHRHHGFGGGIHSCAGAPLARAEVELGLTAVLARLPRIALARHVPEPVRWSPDLVVHGPERLLVCGQQDARDPVVPPAHCPVVPPAHCAAGGTGPAAGGRTS